MKKILSSLLIVMVLFNFILCCGKSYAEYAKYNSQSGKEIEQSLDAEKQENVGSNQAMSIISTTLGAIVGIFAELLVQFPEAIADIMMLMSDTDIFSIKKTVFNEIPLFNINFFDLSTINNPVKGSDEAKKNPSKAISANQYTINRLRMSVAKWYYTLRLISIAASLLVLIYIGIRMALSTIASDKIHYKEMLIYWFESIIILFLMPYILSTIFAIANSFTDMFSSWENILLSEGEKNNFEIIALNTINDNKFLSAGWEFALYTIVYWFLIGLQFKFFVNYLKRVLTVAFLIIISPLVTITYAIDKVGDGKAQAFISLIMELSVNVAIQPLHAIIYLIFMATAGEIANKSILVALIFMLFMSKVEKFILHLFNMRNVVTLKAVNEEKGISI